MRLVEKMAPGNDAGQAPDLKQEVGFRAVG